MRLRVRHETAYAYETPAKRAIETVRLTPRGNDGQFVVDWRIDVDRDCRLEQSADPFGNTVHSFAVEGPLPGFVIVAEGRLETTDTSGMLSGQVERFPPVIFLRETPLTASDEAIRTLADEHRTGKALDVMHGLMAGIRERVRFKIDATDTGTSAIDALKGGQGVCQDFAHIFVAACRHLDVPARYVSGYLLRTDTPDQDAGHAWAEALVDGLGWVGFDPTNGISPTDAYIRLAVGLDYLGAAPVRGARYGGSGEKLTVRVEVEDIGRGPR